MGGGSAPHEIPDWKSYKVEGIPELERLQKRLGALGLKDPWIRNEVWRFQPKAGPDNWMRVGLKTTFRGFGYALVAVGLTILFDRVVNGSKHEQGHH